MHHLALGDLRVGDSKLPAAYVAQRARLTVSKLGIEQIRQVLGAKPEFQHAVDRPAYGAERVALGVHGNAAADRGGVVAGTMPNLSEVDRREKEVALREDDATIGFDGLLADFGLALLADPSQMFLRRIAVAVRPDFHTAWRQFVGYVDECE